MAEETGRVMRDLIDAFNSGGTEAALRHMHPEIVWNAPPEWLEDRVYRGHEGMRKLAAGWMGQFDEYRLDLEQVIELDGDRAVALGHQRGRIKESGVPVEQAIGWVVEVSDAKLIRVDVYFSWEATLEAAGLEGHPPV
jgi:ketosteroid isomerase-like protein